MNDEMGGTILRTIAKENDLGVTIYGNLKVSQQCRVAAYNVNRMCGMIRRNVTYKVRG